MKNRFKPVPILLAALVLLVLAFMIGYGVALSTATHDPAKGFRLPPGDDEAGMEAFSELGCVACHSVKNSTRFPLPETPADWHVMLGGEVGVIKTYGELVTAIIHPSESIRPDVRRTLVDEEGKSIMPDLTRQMTTRQLVDLVTYLQHEYEVVLPDYPTNYYPYGLDVIP
ncbi:MAG TPA: cytochrome c [Oceanipulchritudo sp.]|nr:cytochrome c [Oceanipulchritudo sp.]